MQSPSSRQRLSPASAAASSAIAAIARQKWTYGVDNSNTLLWYRPPSDSGRCARDSDDSGRLRTKMALKEHFDRLGLKEVPAFFNFRVHHVPAGYVRVMDDDGGEEDGGVVERCNNSSISNNTTAPALCSPPPTTGARHNSRCGRGFSPPVGDWWSWCRCS